ncbi:MAG: alpha/beta hydrolase-fold protein [Saprospiraceae bacterium]
MNKLLRTALLTVWAVSSLLSTTQAQLTFNVTSIPFNTPPGDQIYAVGTFNNWDPGDATKTLSANGSGQYTLTVNPPAGEVKFKFTRGNWDKVEGNASGGYLPDRVFNYNGQPTTIDISILSWEDLSGGNPNSTAAPNVFVLDNNFYIPQLNRERRIWLYLPPDYQTTSKKYPVLYMHDAQNLFDVATSFSGEWEVDESLNQLFQEGDYGCIVVGIDNGRASRLDEYSPWFNSDYNEGGEGAAYVEFIANTLKPHIDSLYRTLPDRLTTGIMGSSMGGLISMYALSERQDVFSKAGIFSPAFWFAGNNPANHVATHPKQGDVRVYFLAGGDEPNYVEQDMLEVANAMTTAGFSMSEKLVYVPSDGQHAEWFWAREFPDAYEWLFQNAVTSVNWPKKREKVEIYPNPSSSWVRFTGLAAGEIADLQVLGADGALWRDTTITGGEPLWTGDLPAGFYVVKLRKKGGKWVSGKLVRQ